MSALQIVAARRLPRRHRRRPSPCFVKTVSHFLAVVPARPARRDRTDDPGAAHGDAAARVPRPHPDVAAAGRGGGALVRDGLLRGAVLHPAHRVRPALRPDFALPLIGHFLPLRVGHRVLRLSAGFSAILVLMAIRQKNHPRSAAGERRAPLAVLRLDVLAGLLRRADHPRRRRSASCLLRGARVRPSRRKTRRPARTRALHFPLTGWIGDALHRPVGRRRSRTAIVVVAAVKILISFAWMITIALQPTMGVAWHRFLASSTSGSSATPTAAPRSARCSRSRSTAQPIDFENIEDLDEDAALGVGKVEDFTWKGLLDFTTCTECGRCQSPVPGLEHREAAVPQAADHGPARPRVRQGAVPAGRRGGRATASRPRTTQGRRPRSSRWSATPATTSDHPLTAYNPHGPRRGHRPGRAVVLHDLRRLRRAVPGRHRARRPHLDMRRYQVLIESAFPAELERPVQEPGEQGQPVGHGARGRGWTGPRTCRSRSSSRRRRTSRTLDEVDCLFWVGCAGAYEDRAKKTTRAVAELLDTAGVSLRGARRRRDLHRRPGPPRRQRVPLPDARRSRTSRPSTRPAPRRSSSPARTASTRSRTSTRSSAAATRSCTTPSCSTGWSARSGSCPCRARATRRRTGAASTAPTVTYHDPCYLGRHNDVYAPPRELLEVAARRRAAPRWSAPREKSFCCGAGGARMWMEEKLGTRINTNRTEEAVATGADQIAVGCPFCRVMLSDGLTAAQADGQGRARRSRSSTSPRCCSPPCAAATAAGSPTRRKRLSPSRTRSPHRSPERAGRHTPRSSSRRPPPARGPSASPRA